MYEGFDSKTTGLEEMLARLEKMKNIPDPSAVVTAGRTTGTYRRIHQPSVTEERSPGENIMIIRSQAKHNHYAICTTSPAEQAHNVAEWRRGLSEFLRTLNPQALLDAAMRVAEYMRDRFRDHVHDLPSVKECTQRRKEWEAIRPDAPTMVRTGQVLASLTPLALDRSHGGRRIARLGSSSPVR